MTYNTIYYKKAEKAETPETPEKNAEEKSEKESKKRKQVLPYKYYYIVLLELLLNRDCAIEVHSHY